MAKKITLEFTQAEVNHLLLLVLDNEREGSYYSNQKNWNKQTESLKAKLSEHTQ